MNPASLKGAPPATSGGGRLTSIDCLRGAAALGVVIHHALELRGDPAGMPGWFHIVRSVLIQGYLGIPLFFVISGFCIHLRCAQALSRGQKPSLGFVGFWKRRIHRLYPPYFVALCLSMSTLLVAYFLGIQRAIANYPAPQLRWLGLDFLTHVFMLHGFFARFDEAGGNPPFWTLAREEYLYLLYFFVFAWRARFGIYPMLATVLGLGLTFTLILRPFFSADSEWSNVIFSSAIVLWIQWCLGMLAVEAYYGVVQLPGWASSAWVALALVPIAKLAELHFRLLSPALWGFTFFILVNYCVRQESQRRLPATQAVRWLTNVGLFSYSLYLIHVPVQRVLTNFLPASTSVAGYTLVCLLLIALSLGAGKIFFVLVERRVINVRPPSTA